MQDYTAKVNEILPSIDFEKKTYEIQLTTSLGEITLEFFPDKAPNHCKNMIALSKLGFYDGIIFHRIIAGFVIQVGCPLGTGTGGPGYQIKAEFNDIPHEEGILSMARTNDPDSGGSQFFICLGRLPSLDNQYTVFGKTKDPESLNIVKKLGSVTTGQGDRPLEEVKIERAKVIES